MMFSGNTHMLYYSFPMLITILYLNKKNMNILKSVGKFIVKCIVVPPCFICGFIFGVFCEKSNESSDDVREK